MIILFLKLKKNVKKNSESMDMCFYNKFSKFNLSSHYNISRMLSLISYIKIITFTQIAA